MSLQRSSAGLQRANARCVPISSVDENSTESLVIEDLDLANLNISSSTGATSESTETEPSPGEYVGYEAVDENNLFGEQTPAVISETYLMDDLYILVKIPNNPRKFIPTTTVASQTTPKRFRATASGNSNRIIYPIQEEVEKNFIEVPRSKIPVMDRVKSKRLCWEDDNIAPEEFASTTNIIHCNDLSLLPNQIQEPEQSNEPIIEVRHAADNQRCSAPCQNQIELREINLDTSHFKDRTNVSLENYGILITPTKALRTENLLVFQVDTEPRAKEKVESFACFEWLMKIFRRKRRRTGFVHAKVYKTYFVKWNKFSNHAECSNCQCGASKKSRRNSAQF